MNKPFDNNGKYARNKTSRTGASTPRPALDIRTLEGGPAMPVKGNITVSGDSASGQFQISQIGGAF